jgi:hypothetical protein
VGATVTASQHLHSWHDVAAAPSDPGSGQSSAPAITTGNGQGVTIAAAALAGLVGALSLLLALMVVSFAAFFLLGAPALLLLVVAGGLWGAQVGFGSTAPLEGWLAGAVGAAVLALALNTGAALPIYWSLVFGSGRRLDRLRDAWSSYWAMFRSLVMPACALFGIVVFRLLAAG